MPYLVEWETRMSQPLVGMDLADLREALGSDQPGYRATQVYEAIYRGRATDLAGISALPTALRQSLAERIAFGLPEIARRFESADGTRRYLLRLEDGRTVETVLMPEGERDTMCISSQAGCAVDCKFCMTALLGLERNLTAGEIVGQVLTLLHDNNLDRAHDPRRLNIVMMDRASRCSISTTSSKPPASCSIPSASGSRRDASRFPPPALCPRSPKWDANRCGPNWRFLSTPPPKRRARI